MNSRARSLLCLLAIATTSSSHAAHPDSLVWTDCGSNAKCGDLEFCQDGDKYGYRDVRAGGGDVDGAPCGEGSSPGPLLRMTKGTVYRLALHNAASANTNVHTHGLHVVGDGDGDDVTRVAEGGGDRCLSYTWDIAADHPPGTYFYHPHYHGRTNEQVAGGAFGTIVVEDEGGDGVREWARDATNERILLVSSSGGKNDYDGGSSWNNPSEQRWDSDDRDEGTNLRANGVDRETFRVLPDRWYRLRTAVVTPDAKPNDLAFGDGCTVYKVASDGVWHAARLTAYKGLSFELTGASRADFAIRCSAGTNAISWGGSDVATVDANAEYVSAGGVPSTGDDASDLGDAPPRPTSVADLSSASVADSNRFMIVPGKASIRFNGNFYQGMSGLGSINFDEVYEMQAWDTKGHPFHLHLYHMQIMTPGGCGSHAEGEFYDTISGAKDQPCTVRFRTADVGQKMVMHCHELEHEDGGSINFLNVVNVPKSMQNNVDSPSYACPSGSAEPTTAIPAVAAGEGSCNVSFCAADSDCCSGSCRHYGRCSNIDSGIHITANGTHGFHRVQWPTMAYFLFLASFLPFVLN